MIQGSPRHAKAEGSIPSSGYRKVTSYAQYLFDPKFHEDSDFDLHFDAFCRPDLVLRPQRQPKTPSFSLKLGGLSLPRQQTHDPSLPFSTASTF